MCTTLKLSYLKRLFIEMKRMIKWPISSGLRRVELKTDMMKRTTVSSSIVAIATSSIVIRSIWTFFSR